VPRRARLPRTASWQGPDESRSTSAGLTEICDFQRKNLDPAAKFSVASKGGIEGNDHRWRTNQNHRAANTQHNSIPDRAQPASSEMSQMMAWRIIYTLKLKQLIFLPIRIGLGGNRRKLGPNRPVVFSDI
jgi:hypothetical protein